MHPITELTRGSKAYWRGVKWLTKHPLYLFLLIIPSLLGLAGMIAAGTLFLRHHSSLLSIFIFEPGQGWWWIGLYYLSWLVFHIAAFVVIVLIGLILSSVLAAPIYEFISQAIEKQFFPGLSIELSFWQALKVLPEEIKKMFLIGVISVAFLLVPGLNLIAVFGAAFLVAWDFYDYPFARRGMRLAKRLQLARGDAWAMLGMSLWFLIPILQFVLVPMAVVGGTLLSLESLAKSERQVLQ